MQLTMKLAACLGVAAALCGSAVTAQTVSSPARVAAVNAVIDYRVSWMEDVTPFDACRVYEAMGTPGDFAGALTRPARRVVAADPNPCVGVSRAAPRLPARIVRVDSVALGDTTAIVYATVWKGEKRILETYALRRNPGGAFWGIRSVTQWGALRVHASSSARAVPSSQTPK